MIGDVADPSERGGFFGMYSIGPMVGSNSICHDCKLA